MLKQPHAHSLTFGFGPAFMLRAEVARELIPCCLSAGVFTTNPHTC